MVNRQAKKNEINKRTNSIMVKKKCKWASEKKKHQGHT